MAMRRGGTQLTGDQGIQLDFFLTGFDEVLGALDAYTDKQVLDRYMDNALPNAIRAVEDNFELAAAAYSRSNQGALNHMYEYMPDAVRKSQVNYALPLWRIIISGTKAKKAMAFPFVMATVPTPSPDDEIMLPAGEVLKKHVFWNKAFVMETGAQVTVKPGPGNDGRAILIPISDEDPAFRADQWDKARGYMMKDGEFTFTPGRRVRGNFSTYAISWWNSFGQELVEKEFGDQFRMKLEKQIRKARRGGKKVRISDVNMRITKISQQRSRELIASWEPVNNIA